MNAKIYRNMLKRVMH